MQHHQAVNNMSVQPHAFSYTSVHEFLDELFKDHADPTNEQIIKAKENYWRSYHKHYRRWHRSKYREFTIRLSARELALLKIKAGALPLCKSLKNLVSEALHAEAERSVLDKQLLGLIHQNILHLAQLSEDTLDGEPLDAEEFLERTRQLEKQFNQLIAT